MLIVPAADVRPDAAFEQPRTHLQQLDAEEDKDDTAGSYAELMAKLAQKVHSTPPPPQHSPSTPPALPLLAALSRGPLTTASRGPYGVRAFTGVEVLRCTASRRALPSPAPPLS